MYVAMGQGRQGNGQARLSSHHARRACARVREVSACVNAEVRGRECMRYCVTKRGMYVRVHVCVTHREVQARRQEFEKALQGACVGT